MITEFVQLWDKHKNVLEAHYASNTVPDDYKDIVTNLVRLVLNAEDNIIDPERIHKIDDGNYQGTLVFILGEDGYQPSSYYSVMVGYGSCSGCDTLERIRGYDDKKCTKEQVSDLMTLSLHIIQKLKRLNDGWGDIV